MIRTRIFLFCAFLSISSFGQNTTTVDSTSIISYADKIILKLNVDTQANAYSITDKLTNTTTDFIPNNGLRLSLSLDYEFVGVSVGFSPKFLPENDDNDLKGESSFSDFGFRFFLGNWTQELIYSNIKGYYIENTQDFIPGWVEGEDPYIQFPDLKTIKYGGSTSYIFNDRFSFRNLVYQTEWQRESAGSFLPKLEYTYIRISNRLNNVKSADNAFDVKVAPSYYYTWVLHKNWFASAFLSPAIGVRFINSTVEENNVTQKETNEHFIKTLESGFQLGFSSEKWIFGLNLNFDANWYNEDRVTIILEDKFYAKVYLGYRLNAPKFLTRLNDKLFN